MWLFWEQGWRFKNWYVNLEEPLARWAGGVDSEDHFLDISVYPDRSWQWRDEDEFAQAQRAGLMDARAAARVREAGRSAVEGIRAWGAPFSDGWQHWRPDPAWAGTVSAGRLGPYARAHGVMRPLMRPRAATVGSSSARARRRQLPERAAGLTDTSPRGGRT